MKRTISVMASVIMLFVALFTTTPATARPLPRPDNKETSLLKMIPDSFIIEQTATLADGYTVTVYYKRDGIFCEVYSEDSLEGYDVESIAGVCATNFRIVDSVKGKRLYRTTLAKARKIVKNLVNSFL